jgi:hypothetical protein
VDTPIPTPSGWPHHGRTQSRRRGVRGRRRAVPGARSHSRDARPACREVVISDGQTIVGDIAHRWSTTTKSVLCDVVLELVASLGLRPVKRKKSLTSQEAVDDVAFRVNFTPHLTVIRLERTGRRARARATRANASPLRRGLTGTSTGCRPGAGCRQDGAELLGVVADQHRSGCPRNRGHPRSV